jgi:hypothetical protein
VQRNQRGTGSGPKVAAYLHVGLPSMTPIDLCRKGLAVERISGLPVLALLGAVVGGQAAEQWVPPEDLPTIPLWLKMLYSAFVAVLVPAYRWHYGPANFLWFSDIALLLTLATLWSESPLLASMQAVSIGLLELVWVADFLIHLLTGANAVGLSRYMFKPEIPLFIRALSLFHLWLPVLLLWLVWRLGYDRRAWAAQSVLAVGVLLLCYFLTDRSDNINWVFGPGEKPQRRLPSGLYLILLMAFFGGCVYFPTHLLLQRLFAPP